MEKKRFRFFLEKIPDFSSFDAVLHLFQNHGFFSDLEVEKYPGVSGASCFVISVTHILSTSSNFSVHDRERIFCPRTDLT